MTYDDLPPIHTDYLIIGQGLAGTLLAHFLLEAGRQVHVIDDDYPRAASKVAAGIINPVTGRRYVKSWRIDELLPFAEQTYRRLEQLLDLSLYHPRPILRVLFNQREENDWQLRAYDPAYQAYVLPKAEVDIASYARYTLPAFAYGELRQGAQVEIGTLVQHYRRYLLQKAALTAGDFDFSKLHITESGVQYENIHARRLIFCEGAKAKANPFFSYLPYEGNKGETLTVRIPDAVFQKILKHRIFIVPLTAGRYWIGSTSNNYFAHDLPTEEGKSYLLQHLQELLQTPFTVEDHQAAIRPTIKDRRPLLGKHPEYPQLFIFNGLGTKGASLGPFWAKHLSEVLLDNGKIDPEVDIARFKGKAWK